MEFKVGDKVIYIEESKPHLTNGKVYEIKDIVNNNVGETVVRVYTDVGRTNGFYPSRFILDCKVMRALYGGIE